MATPLPERLTQRLALPALQLLALAGLSLLLGACGTTTPRPVASTPDRLNDLVLYALSLADKPYRHGGKAPETGFDCSGFVGHVYRTILNIELPRTSAEISRVGRAADRSRLHPGDLVFFNTQSRAYSHVGIYIGEGKFIHAPRSGARIRVESLYEKYWSARYDGARRIYF